MKTKVAINGFGRVGRGAFKIAFGRDDIEIVAINDLSNIQVLAHLLKHDSVYGAYGHQVSCDENNLIVDSQPIKALKQSDISLLPWGELGVDVVIEATGKFTVPDLAKAHIAAGAKKVIVTATTKGEGVSTVIIGVNEDKLKQAGDIISTGGSTTTCITPVLDVIAQNFGIDKVMVTAMHSYTSEQKLADGASADWREARAAAYNLIPMAKSGSTAAVQACPALAGKFENMSVKVPTMAVSLADFTVVVKKSVTAQEVNEAFRQAAKEPYYQGILAVSDEELVSCDFIGNSHSATVDTKLTKVVGGNMVKVVIWYDNEWGYCNRLIELVADTGKLISNPPEPIAVESSLEQLETQEVPGQQ